MTYSECIKAGFRLVHRNWQLVLIQVALSLANCIAFFIIVGIPLLAAVIVMGLDIAELTKLSDFLATIENPFELLKKYFTIGAVLVIGVLIYMTFSFSLWIYVFGGSTSVLGRAVRGPHKFNLREFYSDGRRLFFPLMWYMAITGLIFVAGLFALGLAGSVMAGIISTLATSTVKLFLQIFFTLLAIVIGMGITVASTALMLFGTAFIVFEGCHPSAAIKKTLRYLRERPQALGLYGLTALCYIAIYMVAFAIALPFRLIPVIGQVILLPYQLFLYFLLGYLNLIVVAVVFSYFFSTFSDSTQRSGISEEAPAQVPPPQGTAGTGSA